MTKKKKKSRIYIIWLVNLCLITAVVALFVGIVLFVPAYGVVLSMILRKLQSLANSRQFA